MRQGYVFRMLAGVGLEQLLADLDDPGADDFVIGYGLQAIRPALSILSNVERHLRLHRAR